MVIDVRLDDKKVAITAGAAGIGFAIAKLMAESGANVQLCDIDENAMEQAARLLPSTVGMTRADVAKPTELDRFFDHIGTNLGGLDILINNAGVSGRTTQIEDIEASDLERTLAVNVLGQLYCVQRAAPMLKMAKSGVITNISSVAGRLGYAHRSAYSASKWGVIGLTQSLAIELGLSGIRVNAVCPGAVAGPPLDRAIADKAQTLGLTSSIVRQRYMEQASMCKLVSPEDVANLVIFLCSDFACSISGQVISVDGNTLRLI